MPGPRSAGDSEAVFPPSSPRRDVRTRAADEGSRRRARRGAGGGQTGVFSVNAMDERNGGGSCVRCCLRGVLWGLVPLALIVAGAWFANRDTVEETLRRDVEAALRAAGIGWAGVEVAGRDVTLTGAAPSRATIAAARRAALAVRGVRRVNAAEVEIRPELPGVRPLTTAKAPLILRGTWPAAPGTELTVTVAGRTYRAGDSPALTVHDGEWTLRLEKLPPDGVYEVEVTVRDGAVTVRDSTRHELVVDTTPPARPGIETVSVQGRAAEIAGTWPAGDARTLVVAVDGHVWKLGESPALEAENGRWRLRTGELPEGSHDVTVTVADAVGNTASTTAAGAVVVDTTPPPPAVVDSVKVDGRRVTVTGRWPAAEAKALMVSLAGHSYWLGDTPELTADGERWTLRVENVPEGAHDIVVAVTDAAGNRTESRKEKAVRVDTTPPPVTALAIDSARLEGDTAVLEGRWPQGDAVTLEARLGERTHHLGEGGDFRRAGDGRWRLRVRGLTPGRHDLTLIQRDAAGNESRRTFSGVIAVPVPRPTPRPQPAEEEKQPKAGGSDAGQPTMPEKQGKADRARPAPMATRPADTTPPPAPVVPDLTTNRRRPVIVGRWPAAEAVALEAELDGRILTPRPGGPLTVT
ncbi:MAG TPA: BON domain-containing protein, partial [Thermopetrobacter sp.]|nr:BON domain-containing protein [Thermopetrobacter sp.]